MAEFKGRGACDCCEKAVDVYADKNGMAYYNCGPCGFRGLHRNRRTSDAVIARLDRGAEPEDGPPAPPAAAPVASTPPAPRARPAPAPAVPKPAPAAPAPAQAKKPGIFSNFSL